jgi:hypothetical protein
MVKIKQPFLHKQIIFEKKLRILSAGKIWNGGIMEWWKKDDFIRRKVKNEK